ncbi:hypothetical protein RBH76_10605 [Oscillospiraceae bacterium MB24-C1]|nr:hypothetical protein RBH76_10605 [Oscillospiraceae bacterium MB24-C1]
MKIDKYEQLTLDLQHAGRTAAMLFGDSEDGGTCNFDAITITLPRWNVGKVKTAVEAADMSAWKNGSYYVVNPRTSGQANRRTRICEAIKKELKSKGYDVGMFYMVD